MRQNNANVNLEADSLNVVILPPTAKLKGEWMFVFRGPLAELPEKLTPSAKAVLFNMMALGSVSVYGLIMVHTPSLLNCGISRSTVFRAIQGLEDLGVVARGKTGIIYLSPFIAYRGSGRDWGIAVTYWNGLRTKLSE
jgi:hypothetical protein